MILIHTIIGAYFGFNSLPAGFTFSIKANQGCVLSLPQPFDSQIVVQGQPTLETRGEFDLDLDKLSQLILGAGSNVTLSSKTGNRTSIPWLIVRDGVLSGLQSLAVYNLTLTFEYSHSISLTIPLLHVNNLL